MKSFILILTSAFIFLSCSSDSSTGTNVESKSQATNSSLAQDQYSSSLGISASSTSTASTNGKSGTFVDSRDGHVYKWQQMTVSFTAAVRNPVYMAENLAYAPPNGDSWCYDDNSDNCTKYGRLYTWETAMNGAASSQLHPSGVQGICPDGWHLPSLQEWETLTEIAKYRTAYMNPTGWDQSGIITAPSNANGFSALPAGQRLAEEGSDENGNSTWYNDELFVAYYWSATKLESQFAISWRINNREDLAEFKTFSRESMNIDAGLSVRCIQNQ